VLAPARNKGDSIPEAASSRRRTINARPANYLLQQAARRLSLAVCEGAAGALLEHLGIAFWAWRALSAAHLW